MSDQTGVVLLPDAGPLITLAYADALDLLFKPGGPLVLVDMVLDEVTRNQTPTSQKLEHWAKAHALPVLPTRIFLHLKQMQGESCAAPRRANLGELAIQEAVNDFALESPPRTGVFLFEDHTARNGPVIITDRGRQAHVLLTIEEYRRIAGGVHKIADLLAMPGIDEVELEIPRWDELPRPADLS